VASRLVDLGARIDGDEARALVFDAGPGFADGGDAALMELLEAAWTAVLDVAPDLIAAERPGKLVFVAPAPRSGPLAAPAADALENLARTLSVEWARHGITTCAIARSDETTAQELAELIGYLLSPAGDYISGTRLELRGPGPAAQPRGR
jgi:NAD(P)-dependent dehydrogenase (short-subunit alcohol dehydrogenase family)